VSQHRATPTDGWIAVDLDGTLAEYHGWPKDGSIGPPVPTMVRRVRAWLAEGREVRIFTARVSESREYSAESGRYADLRFVMEQREKIREWCQKHIGTVLPVTCEKDFRLAEIWDDRSVRVECNTGREL
jgi:hypothetical protein